MTKEKIITSFTNFLVRDNNYSPYTVRTYLKHANEFLNIAGTKITDKHLKDFRERVATTPNISYKTRNLQISSIRALLSFMNTQGHNIQYHDFLKGFRNRNGYKVLTLPSDDELIRFITPQNATEPSTIDVLIRLLYVSGLRIAEALALSQPLTERVTVNGKGAKPRLVFIDQTTIAMANNLVHKRNNKKHTDKLFPFTARHIQREFAKRSSERNITTTITPHTLRHLFATTMLSKGTDIRVVQRLLGHASIATTQIYAQVSDTLLEQAHSHHPLCKNPLR